MVITCYCTRRYLQANAKFKSWCVVGVGAQWWKEGSREDWRRPAHVTKLFFIARTSL